MGYYRIAKIVASRWVHFRDRLCFNIAIRCGLLVRSSEIGSNLTNPILKFSEWNPRVFAAHEPHSEICRIGFVRFYHPRRNPTRELHAEIFRVGFAAFYQPRFAHFCHPRTPFWKFRIGFAGGNPILKFSECGSWVIIFATRETETLLRTPFWNFENGVSECKLRI